MRPALPLALTSSATRKVRFRPAAKALEAGAQSVVVSAANPVADGLSGAYIDQPGDRAVVIEHHDPSRDAVD